MKLFWIKLYLIKKRLIEMDYEQNYSYSNKRVLLIIIIGLWAINSAFHPLDMIMKKPEINTTINETNNTIIIYRNITVTVTPTPDGITYFAGSADDGVRKLGRIFTWDRRNVEGKKDLSGYVKVYDYRTFDSVHIFLPTDYNYYEVKPADDKKYLFIFVKIWLDDIGSNVDKLWLPNESHYIADVSGIAYSPIQWEKQLRIRELEEIWNDNNDFRIGYYGVFNTYSRDLKRKSTAGEYAEDLYYVYSGESNAIDGYIIYEIPKDSKDENIIILSNIHAFGNPSWKLKV